MEISGFVFCPDPSNFHKNFRKSMLEPISAPLVCAAAWGLPGLLGDSRPWGLNAIRPWGGPFVITVRPSSYVVRYNSHHNTRPDYGLY